MTFKTQEQAAHLNDFPLARQRDWTAAKIVAVYAFLGSLWILFSDRLVEDLVADHEMVNTLGTLKGWGYILVTALLLYSLIQAYTAALREREERLRLALMATNQGLYDLNVQTGEAQISPEYAALLGYDPADFHENEASWTERLHPDDRQRAVEAYHAYLRGDIPAYAVEFRQRTQSGEWKWIQSMGRIVERDAEGRPLRMMGTQSDISARKRAEAERETAVTALRESESKLRTLFEILPVGISILDAQRQVMTVNPALKKILEVSGEELRSSALQARRYIRPDHTPMPAAEFASVRALNEQTAVHDIETGIVTDAGRVIWANVSAVPVAFPDWRVVVVTSNITERKQRERELEVIAAVSEALRAAPTRDEMLPIIVSQIHFLLAVDGIMLAMRDPLTEETVVTQAGGTWIRHTGSRLPPNTGVTGHVIATGQLYLNNNAQKDSRLLWQDESAPFHAVACGPLSAEQHTIGALLIGRQRPDAIFSDHDMHLLSSIGEIAANALYRAQVLETLEARIEERTRELSEANERLRELDRLKSQFVSDVSHELRTPVTNLKLYVDLLELGKPEKFASYITILKQQSRRLTDLVENILDLSRLEGEQNSVTLAPLDLNSLVEQVVTAHLPRAAAANVQLVFNPGLDLPRVQGSANQLTQVVTNLVANALNYTTAGQVSVSTLHSDNRVCVQVRDTGLGIAPDDVPHVFERFYRGRNISRSAVPGTGLGLAIVKEIVDAHHGWIEVDSQVGSGTTFHVCLPAAADQADKGTPV